MLGPSYKEEVPNIPQEALLKRIWIESWTIIKPSIVYTNILSSITKFANFVVVDHLILRSIIPTAKQADSTV